MSFFGTQPASPLVRSFVALLFVLDVEFVSSESQKPSAGLLQIMICHETQLILHASVSFKYYDRRPNRADTAMTAGSLIYQNGNVIIMALPVAKA